VDRRKLGGSEESTLGVLGFKASSSNSGGTRGVMIPRSPTGDGEAMSRSAPLQGWSFSVSYHNALQEFTAPLCTLHGDRTTRTGDGEHQSFPEPVGSFHLGSGAKPQCPRCGRLILECRDLATCTVRLRCRCGWRKLVALACSRLPSPPSKSGPRCSL